MANLIYFKHMGIVVLLIIAVGVAFMVLERIFPDQELAEVPGWWLRVIFLNVLQLGVVFLGGVSWEHWFVGYSALSLNELSILVQIPIAYLLITFVFYFWHRARHDINVLWLSCHQLHHSPSRIETITSFYKHPVELIANGIIISFLNFAVLGITVEAGVWTTFVTAVAEFFYHMNIRTPHWVGYFLQRPEMHRIHHERDKHYYNFADLPVWDMIFGTYRNPPHFAGPCGFKPGREESFWRMLSFLNVNNPFSGKSGMRTGKKRSEK